MEEESDLERLALGGFAAPAVDLGLYDGIDEAETLADLSLIGGESEISRVLGAPKD